MLQELHIKNLVLIDEGYIEFGKGLNVFTGETGAGKTVLVEAMNLLLGERADCSLIRTGCQEAHIEGLLTLKDGPKGAIEQLKEFASDDDAQYVISRRITREGKNKCYINGKIVTLNRLKDIGNILVDLHGQHEHQSLLKVSTHLDLLDSYAGQKVLAKKREYTEIYNELKILLENLKALKEKARERARKEDLLHFQIEEIEKAGLKLNEEDDLRKERDVLSNIEKISEAVNFSRETISGDTQYCLHDLLAGIEESLSKVFEFDSELADIYQRIKNISFELDDLGQLLSLYAEGLGYNSGRLEEIEDRLAAINSLKKKYGENIEQILAFKDKAQVEADSLMTVESRLSELELDLVKKEKRLAVVAKALSEEREKAALNFEKEVTQQLSELNMPKVKFSVQILNEKLGDAEGGILISGERFKYFPGGLDIVEFTISPNPGEPLKPLAKIASGGEVSRIMLALKGILAKVDSIPILIFDEIDSGVGGETAGFVGQKVGILSDTHQVICITHLPQIAVFADSHFRVFKKEKDGRTQTFVEALFFEDRIDEIARMLSGRSEVTELSKKHALELIELAKKTIEETCLLN